MTRVTKTLLKQKAWVLPGLLAFCILLTSVPAMAQSSRDVNNRLNRLENELDTLSRAIYRGERPPASAFSGDPASQAGAEVRLQQLEMEVRNLTGKLEEQSYAIQQLRTQLERMTADLEMRMGQVEGGGARSGTATRYTANPIQTPSMPSYSPPPSQPQTQGQDFQWSSSNAAATAPAAGGQLGTITQSANTGAVSGSADQAANSYENAFALLKNANYAGAERGFDEFLKRYPNHALAGNAKYWLGETYYVRGDHERAARIFAEGYQQYPQGAKAPDNLLKLGMSLAGLGNKTDACVALSQLEKEYSSGAGPVIRRAKQEMANLGCGT